MTIREDDEGRSVQAQATVPLVYVVVLNFNGLDVNDTCITSLLASDYTNYKILFVDNGSSDGSVELIRRDYPTVEFLENRENLFFAAGNNRGIEQALRQGADYIFILNNDTRVDSACLSTLVAFMEQVRTAGAVQPLLCLMGHPALIASGGCRVSLSGRAWDDGFGDSCASFGTEPREVSGVTGGAMLVRAQVFREAGTFDERYGMYFEDVDLSWRIRRCGYRLFVVPQARVLHEVSATTVKGFSTLRIRLTETNSYRLIMAHFPLWLIFFGYPLSLFFSLAVAVRAFLRSQPGNAKAAVMGALDGLWMLLPGLLCRLAGRSSTKSIPAGWIAWRTLFPPVGRATEQNKTAEHED